MQRLIPFLKEASTVSIQKSATSWKIKLLLHETLKTYQLELLQNKDILYVKDALLKKLYIFNGQLKIQPIYEVNAKDQHQLSKIEFHSGDKKMTITAENVQKLEKLYSKMKLVFSHKGFNQFFKPIKRLGRGAFATVYLIESKISKKRYAAKVFSKEGQKLSFKGQEALLNQIRTLRFLTHDNIIKYEGVYETDNLIYLVTQYLSGGTLQQFMRDKSNLKGEDIIKILKQILQALQYLQDNYIMHRDIKPQNILLRQSDKKWVLIDFGLSGFSKQDYLYDACGTYGYMAPEMLSISNQQNSQKSKQYNSSCDIYSLGVIAYNLVIGQLPFKVEGGFMIDPKIIWNAFNSPQCKQMNQQVILFLKGLLQKLPEKRLSPKDALRSNFFNKESVKKSLFEFNQKKINERYQKILKIANCN